MLISQQGLLLLDHSGQSNTILASLMVGVGVQIVREFLVLFGQLIHTPPELQLQLFRVGLLLRLHRIRRRQP